MIHAVDLFCGAGGETTGIIDAFKSAGVDYKIVAINHWDVAIETHSTNHPEVKHYCESIQNVDPMEAVPGGRLNFLWASPECTHHSNARGGKPRSNQSRASAWLILKWLQELYVERVYIENVPEFKNWGPLGADGKPLKSKRGKLFNSFIDSLKALGYRVDHRVLNAANYGAPTTRKRFILQAVRGKNKIAWPAETHTKDVDMFASKRWIPARDIIDWDIPGKSIFNRKKPLVPNTIRRIETGIKKYWGEWAEPFLVILRGQSVCRDINLPVPTISCGGIHAGLVEPFLTRYNGGDDRNHSINEPMPVLDCSNRYGVIEPFLTKLYGAGTVCDINNPLHTVTAGGINFGVVEPLIVDMSRPARDHSNRIYPVANPLKTITCRNNTAIVEPFIFATGHTSSKDRSRSLNDPLSTIVTKAEHCIVEPFLMKYYGSGANAKSIGEPLDTITTKDRFALIEGSRYSLDIRFRMLKPHELAAATSFPEDYVFSGSGKDKVKQIGNAVPPKLAEALINAALEAA